MFLKYMHLERYGNEEVDGIEQGTTYVFPKLDGTNAQVWLDKGGNISAGSRNRNLSLDNDNAGFMNHIITDSRIKWLLAGFPELRLYGEWLVPHSLKTYRDDAWRKFYIFDVYNVETGEIYHYDRYKEILDAYELDYLAPIAIVKNGTREHYEKCLDKNVFLIKDGMGVGEGIVIKNYEWENKFGNTVWAKMITNSFKENTVLTKDQHISDGGPQLYYDLPFRDWVTVNDMVEFLSEKQWGKYSWIFKDILKACTRFGKKSGTDEAYDAKKIIYYGCRLLMSVTNKTTTREYLQQLLNDKQFKENRQ